MYDRAPMCPPSRSLTITVFVALFALIALTACGTRTVNTGKAEGVIKRSIVEQTGVEVTVIECPKRVEAKRGNTFTCEAKGIDGTSANVRVTQQDSTGNVSFEARLIDQTKVQRTISDSLTRRGRKQIESVDCPNVVEIVKGYRYTCAITYAQGKKGKVGVALTNGSGEFDFNLQ